MGNKRDYKHRCPIYRLPRKIVPFVGEDKSDSKKSFNLWVYDFECSISHIKNSTEKFKVNCDGMFEEMGSPEVVMEQYSHISKHNVNFVCYRNVFTNEKASVTFEEFMDKMINGNGGRNIALAHNAAGYDSRFIFDYIHQNYHNDQNMNIIKRGNKIMQMKVGETIFRDTLLHMPGSLARLASDVLKGRTDVVVEKGYFPHLFNCTANESYIGPLPDRKYFDLHFTMKSEGDLTKFNDWYNSYEGEWDFQKEIKKYCENDVDLLYEIVKSHHTVCTEAGKTLHPDLAYSPFTKATSAGYVHSLSIGKLSIEAEIPPIVSKKKDEENNNDEHMEKTEKLARDGWCTLLPQEYYFARRALRGGRTEIRKHYYKGDIKYMDIMSEYPAVQILPDIEVCGETVDLKFPVGYPNINVYQESFYPCPVHCKDLECFCTAKKDFKNIFVTLYNHQPDYEILKTFFGFACVDITPSQLYHPVLPYFDLEKGKSVFSCEPLIKAVIPSPELQLALRMGYQVTKVYRIDNYKSSESPWKEMLGEMYKLKLYNSMEAKSPNENETNEEWKRRIYSEYEKLGIEIDFNDWGKRPAKKLTGKILINSAWGKHAESVDHVATKILGNENHEELYRYTDAFVSRKYELKSFSAFGEHTIFNYTEDRVFIKPKLSKGYLPCAVFVPMYGRMMLYNHLSKLGERVLMCDTDSIVYHNTDNENEHQILESDIIGGWEEEPGKIIEFVAIGPKSYGVRYEDGNEQMKAKGLCIKRAHQKMINFDVMKNLLFYGNQIKVPQMTFLYKSGEEEENRGTFTSYFYKNFGFDKNILKGNYNETNNQVYPYGYIQ